MTAPHCRIGLVGAGSTAAAYVTALQQADGFEVRSVATRDQLQGMAFSSAHGLAWQRLEALLADPQIDLVLNLTPPLAHAEVSQAALAAGKHVYSEKPLAATAALGQALIDLATRQGLLLACAPATLLQPPLSTLVQLVETGELGRIVSALACVVYEGPELFHPQPAHLYGPAAGPLYDMGVYPLTALLALCGPVGAVQAFALTPTPNRTVRVGPRAGQRFPVQVPTTVHASLHHLSGTISSLVLSFDAMGAKANGLELHGTKAAAHVPFRAMPGADVQISRAFGSWEPVAAPVPPSPSAFAIGVIEAWRSFHADKRPFASAARALDTLLVLEAIAAAAQARAGHADMSMLTQAHT
jgi:predicted dehydrogenase